MANGDGKKSVLLARVRFWYEEVTWEQLKFIWINRSTSSLRWQEREAVLKWGSLWLQTRKSTNTVLCGCWSYTRGLSQAPKPLGHCTVLPTTQGMDLLRAKAQTSSVTWPQSQEVAPLGYSPAASALGSFLPHANGLWMVGPWAGQFLAGQRCPVGDPLPSISLDSTSSSFSIWIPEMCPPESNALVSLAGKMETVGWVLWGALATRFCCI